MLIIPKDVNATIAYPLHGDTKVSIKLTIKASYKLSDWLKEQHQILLGKEIGEVVSEGEDVALKEYMGKEWNDAKQS